MRHFVVLFVCAACFVGVAFAEVEHEIDDAIYETIEQLLTKKYNDAEKAVCVRNNLEDSKSVDSFYTSQMFFDHDLLMKNLENILPGPEKLCKVEINSQSAVINPATESNLLSTAKFEVASFGSSASESTTNELEDEQLVLSEAPGVSSVSRAAPAAIISEATPSDNLPVEEPTIEPNFCSTTWGIAIVFIAVVIVIGLAGFAGKTILGRNKQEKAATNNDFNVFYKP